jgi:hypothetical protein
LAVPLVAFFTGFGSTPNGTTIISPQPTCHPRELGFGNQRRAAIYLVL